MIPLPHPVRAMTEVNVFVTMLSRAAKSLPGVKLLVNNVYEDKTMLITQTNCIIKAVKEKNQPK
jgi:hypothetical protein